MSKLKQEHIKMVEVMTRFGVDLNKTSVEDFVRNQLDYTIPFMTKFNENITKLESLSKKKQDTIFNNWIKSNEELIKIMNNARSKEEVKNES